MGENDSNSATASRSGGRIINDLILVAVILLIALAVYLVFALGGRSGEKVLIILDGEVVSSYSLSEDITFVVGDATTDSYNEVVIKDGKAYVSKAGCPDGICVDHRPIGKSGETIVCLPNRLVVEIE